MQRENVEEGRQKVARFVSKAAARVNEDFVHSQGGGGEQKDWEKK